MPHFDTNTIWMVVALGLAIGLGVANFRRGSGDVAKDTISVLQAQIASLKDEIASLHKENREQASQMASQAGELAAVRKQNEMLETLVRGIPDWSKLHTGLDSIQNAIVPLTQLAAQYGPDAQKRFDAHLEDTATIRRILEARHSRPKVVE